MKTAICPGSFDPVTLGHLDIISRAANMFDKVMVAVLVNPSKHTMFSVVERKEMLIHAITQKQLRNAEVVAFDGLLIDCAKKYNAKTIVKGLRAISDFEYEFQMSLMNKSLSSEIETVFLTTNLKYMYLSSSVVKQIANLGADVSQFVPTSALNKLSEKICKQNRNEV